MRTSDADVERFLKFFTFLPLPAIQSLMDRHKPDASKRLAQHTLAAEFVELVHGAEASKEAAAQHRALHAKPTVSSILGTAQNPQYPVSHKPNPLATNQNATKRQEATFWANSLNKHSVATDQNNAPAAHVVLPKSLVFNQSIARVLYSAGLVSSRSEGHRLAQNQGAYIGSKASGHQAMGDDVSFTPAKLMDPLQTWRSVIRDDEGSGTMNKMGEEGLLVLRQGKWRMRLCRIVSDELFETLGLEDPPGWAEWKALQKADKVHQLQEWEAIEAEQQVNRRVAQENQAVARREAGEYLREERRGDSEQGSVNRGGENSRTGQETKPWRGVYE